METRLAIFQCADRESLRALHATSQLSRQVRIESALATVSGIVKDAYRGVALSAFGEALCFLRTLCLVGGSPGSASELGELAATSSDVVREAFNYVATHARARKLYVKTSVDPAALARALATLRGAADYVRIEPGTFIMGTQPTPGNRVTNEAPQQITITTPFLLKQTPVTQREWCALMDTTPACFWQNPDAPVECVNFFDALAYCNALSRAEGLQECYELHGCSGVPGTAVFTVQRVVLDPTANGYRLPTEREWEYAARAGCEEAAYGPLPHISWYAQNAARTTHPVRQKRPNAWRLYDMLGNVGEWLWDRYSPQRVDDPLGPSMGETNVIRGGSWAAASDSVRAAYRSANYRETRSFTVGFRPMRSLVD